jgi:hypothetical protein
VQVAEVLQFPVGGGGYDRTYWLSRCVGFLVVSADGMRIGTVVELRYGSRLDQPDELVVRAGRLGHRQLAYSVQTVQTIVPAQARLVLGPGAAPTGSAGRQPNDPEQEG